jgi:spore maturation protein CgeB
VQTQIVIFGLSITSSWGNGHATTYRGLVRELGALGADVLFLERDAEWYASNRDLPRPPYGRTEIYSDLAQVQRLYAREVRRADLVIVGSYVPDGIALGEWVTEIAQGVTAFYDIDTPITLARLAQGDVPYISRALIPRYDLYLSFTGGPTLVRLQEEYGAQRARALYCSVDPAGYAPEARAPRWDLGYMGTYSADRQPALERLLLDAARRCGTARFAVVGPQYPEIDWPANVQRIEHLSPVGHRRFYNAQRFTLNLTRADMIEAGYSPSVRLFEAAACGTPIISDYWPGLETYFRIGEEILVSRSADDTLRALQELPDEDRFAIGRRARRRVLAEHTSRHRALELLGYLSEVLGRPANTAAVSAP